MAEKVKKQDTPRQVSEDQRFKYIGFEVYPGKPKDLFKNEAERTKLVEAVQEKRKKGEVIREECKLFEERVSWLDRIVLTLASVIIIAALFLPWFAVHNEIVETTSVPEETVAADEAVAAEGEGIFAEDAPVGEPVEAEPPGAEEAAGEGAVPDEPDIAEAVPEPGPDAGEAVGRQQVSGSEEVIHGYVAKKKVYKEYTRVSAIGALASLGSVGSVVFGSGLALMLTSLLVIGYILLCVALPFYTLYGLWMMKGTADERALRLKKILRYNWLLLMIFGAVLFLSFFGGEYSQPVGEAYDSLGDSYGVGVFLGVLSWGMIVTLAASILIAAKGSEI